MPNMSVCFAESKKVELALRDYRHGLNAYAQTAIVTEPLRDEGGVGGDVIQQSHLLDVEEIISKYIYIIDL